MEIKIKILAEDIRNTNYFSSKDCAITRALHRAGYPNLRDCGVSIMNDNDGSRSNIMNHGEYMKMTDKVINMYAFVDKQVKMNSPVEPEDFEFIIEVDL